jgi:hypothetical protein
MQQQQVWYLHRLNSCKLSHDLNNFSSQCTHCLTEGPSVWQEMDPEADDSEGLRQPEMQVEGNKDAARALLRVKQKLDGYEEGEMRSLQGQVQKIWLPEK